MRKVVDEEVKEKFASLYLARTPVGEIAQQLGITVNSVYKYASEMGLKRGQKRKKPQADAGEAMAEGERPKRKSVLDKPWYLKSQRTAND